MHNEMDRRRKGNCQMWQSSLSGVEGILTLRCCQPGQPLWRSGRLPSSGHGWHIDEVVQSRAVQLGAPAHNIYRKRTYQVMHKWARRCEADWVPTPLISDKTSDDGPTPDHIGIVISNHRRIGLPLDYMLPPMFS